MFEYRRALPYLHYTANDNGGPSTVGPNANTSHSCYASRGVFNTWALTWSPTKIQVSVNGNLCFTNTSGDPAFDKRYIMLLTQGMGWRGNSYTTSATHVSRHGRQGLAPDARACPRRAWAQHHKFEGSKIHHRPLTWHGAECRWRGRRRYPDVEHREVGSCRLTRCQPGHDEGSKALGDGSGESVGEVASVSRDCARDVWRGESAAALPAPLSPIAYTACATVKGDDDAVTFGQVLDRVHQSPRVSSSSKASEDRGPRSSTPPSSSMLARLV
jgi:hypothetical protein